MFRLPVVGYVGCPEIVISGWPPWEPSVFSVGPGPRITYGTGTSTATAIATSVASPAMSSVSERRDMLEDYAEPDHSADPSVNSWCFQMGTEVLSSSISARHAANASARWPQDTPTTTARSPIARSPVLCVAARAMTSGYLPTISW